MAENKESLATEGAAGVAHIVASDEQDEKFRCSFCAQIFASRKEVLVHEWQHKERQTFSCTVCSRSFTNKNLFDRHVAVHNKLGQRGSLCNICNKTFRNHRELDKHHQKDHKGQKSFRCGICGLLYSWMDNLQKHMRVHVDKPIGCFRCHKSFRDEESLNQHALVHKREDVEKRAQGLPVTPSTPDAEELSNIITIGMPGNLTSKIPARTNVINVAPLQQKHIPIATNVVTLAKSAMIQANTDQPRQVIVGTPTKGGESDVEPAAVLDLADPQQMAALLEGCINEDPLTSTAETIDMISALSVDTNANDAGRSNTEASTLDKTKNKSPNILHKDSPKSLSTSISPKQGVKTITYTLARSGANTITSSTTQQSTSVPKTTEVNLNTQTLTEGTNHVIINGTLKGSTVTVVSTVMAPPTGTYNTISSTKHTDIGTGPISASETKLLEQMDKPHRCHVCGECFKYEFTLNAHMPKHKEALPAWESRGVLVPYGAGVKSVVLPKAMPIKPYGCPVCQETFRYDSCLKAHFMKSHPAEYKEKFGVDPKVIQALNVPNPRYKRPYHRKTIPKPDGEKTDKQTPENQNLKPKNQLKVERDKLRKKIDSLIIETPRPVVPKSKKDRLRPMPPHLLAKEMEAQEAREKAEKERLEKEEAERIRLKEEEEERLKREEEEKRKNMKEEKASPEKLATEVPRATEENQEQQPSDERNENSTQDDEQKQFENNIVNSEQNMNINVDKPLFIVPLFNVGLANNIQQPMLPQTADTAANVLAENGKPGNPDTPQTQDFNGRKALETTTIDLSQLKEVTTPIIEEVLHKSPFETVEHNTILSTSEERTHVNEINTEENTSAQDNDMDTDEPTEKLPEHAKEVSSRHSSPEKGMSQAQDYFNTELAGKDSITSNVESNVHDTQSSTTPKKSPPKSRKPRTPKSVEPVHRILTRRKYAYDEEARFKAEREAAQRDEVGNQQSDNVQEQSMEVDNEASVKFSPLKDKSDRLNEADAMEITSDTRESEAKSKDEDDTVNSVDLEQTSEHVSEVTSTVTSNNELETNDSVDAQSIQSESANSVVSLDTAKTCSEDEAVENADTESQKSVSMDQRNDNTQSVKSDGQSEDGLETIVIILKESETNNKKAGPVQQLDTTESDSNKNKSIEEWMDKTGAKEDARSRKGKHMRELRTKLTDEVDEEREPRSLRSTRSTTEQKTESPRVLRKRTKDEPTKDADKKDSGRRLRSSPQKETLRANTRRTLRRQTSPSPLERGDKASRSKSVDKNQTDKKDIEIKLKKCSVSLVSSVLPRDKSVDSKKKPLRDKSVDSENSTDVRSRLRRRRISAESVGEDQKKPTGKDDTKKLSERTSRRRLSTDSVENRESSLKPEESAMKSGRLLRRRPSANSLDGGSRSRSSSCPGRNTDIKGKLAQDNETRKSDRQLRKRSSPNRERDAGNTDTSVRMLRRRNSHTYSTESKREVSVEREGKRSNSENVKSARKLRSSRSSSWEEQAKALSKCSVKLLRCDTPVNQSERDEKENQEGRDTLSMDVDPPTKDNEQSTNGIEATEKEDAGKDPLLSVLEKETELVLNHIQREKETMARAERQAQREAASMMDDRSDDISEKDSVDTASLEMASVTSEIPPDPPEVLPEKGSMQQETEKDNQPGEKEKATQETTKTQEVKETKESRKPKKSRSRKKPEGNNIYELIRQQKDQIQTKVLGKVNHDSSPKEKKSSPDSKKSSPESKKTSPETKQSPESSSISPEHSKEDVNRSKRGIKGKKKSEEDVQLAINHEGGMDNETNFEKEIGIIIPIEGNDDSPDRHKSPDKRKAADEDGSENSQTDSDDNEDLNQLLELATGRTLRSEVQKSPGTDKTKHIYPSSLRENASDFEKAVHLSLMEAQKSRKEKKKKKKHKRDKRDSSPYSLPESCDHSVKAKKKKKKKHKHREHKHKDSKEEKLLDLSEEQVELLEQSFELMMPDLFRQLTIASPTDVDVDQSFSLPASAESKSKKEKKSSPVQNKSPSHRKHNVPKKGNENKSPARESKSPRTDDKKAPVTPEKHVNEEHAGKSKSKGKTQSPKSPKIKKPETPPKSKSKNSKISSVPVVQEELTRTTRAKLARSQAIAFQKQILQDNIPVPAEEITSKASDVEKEKSDRKASRKAEKEKATKKDKELKEKEHKRNKQNEDLRDKPKDRGNNKEDKHRSHEKVQDKRDKYDKKRDYDKRPRTENLFLQDISQTPKFFEHNIPLTNSLAQVPPSVAPIAPVQFLTLTDPSRKRALESLLHTEPPAKIQAIENDVMNNAPPPKRKRGRPPKASKLKNAAPSTTSVITTSTAAVSLTSHIPPMFSHSLSSGVFGSTSTTNAETPAATMEPKEKSTKKGKKRKRGSGGRIEIRSHEIVYMEEKGDSENSLGVEANNDERVIGEVEIKQEVESSGAEDTCSDTHAQSNEADEGREVIMVSVATMTDSSYLMDLRKLILEQEQMEAQAAATAAASDMEREGARTGSNSPRLTVKLYRCDYCTRPFTQRSWMVLHKLREHGYSCQSQAIYMHTLARRVMRRVFTEWRRYGCETCHRRFNHKAHYVFHRSTEHRRKQYRCGVCNLTSDSYMLYQMHAVFVHKAVMIK